MTAGKLSGLYQVALAPLATAFCRNREETHAQAWQRLFIGPWALPSPPWGSVWLDKESVLFGDSTLALRQWMRERHQLEADGKTNRKIISAPLLLLAAWLCGEWSRMQNAKNCWHGTCCRGPGVS